MHFSSFLLQNLFHATVNQQICLFQYILKMSKNYDNIVVIWLCNQIFGNILKIISFHHISKSFQGQIIYIHVWMLWISLNILIFNKEIDICSIQKDCFWARKVSLELSPLYWLPFSNASKLSSLVQSLQCIPIYTHTLILFLVTKELFMELIFYFVWSLNV